ncbi:MAG TPA: VWA domain-containing protein, partial [Vicinamibacteria bacterium]|nr:VWA domain-containing protein [Vicinamibacteria bacterium]
MSLRGYWTVLAFVLVVPARGGAQQAATPATPTFKGGTAVVTLDVVARDKRGRAVDDLKLEEVEVQEDGVKREIASFRFVRRGPAAAPAPAVEVPTGSSALEPARDDTLRLLNLVSIVFDVLDEASRPVARKAALGFLAANPPAGTHIGVFLVSAAGLRLVQPFTDDKDELNRAVQAATGGGGDVLPRSLVAASQAANEKYRRLLGSPRVGPAASSPRTDATTAAEAPNGQFAAGLPIQGGAPPAGGGGELSEITVARFEATAFRAMDLTQRQVQGETSLRPLLALVKGQESIPGRKTILYFGTGLKVPPAVEELFRTTISEANRANVSVYAVDARGLHVSGDTAAARTALEQA